MMEFLHFITVDSYISLTSTVKQRITYHNYQSNTQYGHIIRSYHLSPRLSPTYLTKSTYLSKSTYQLAYSHHYLFP